MSYMGISVKEAMHSINSNVNGWFLPAIQRPYVWGSRYENEKYIVKLFDSLLKSYPIGGLIIWNTDEEIPYREFIRDYNPGEMAKLVDKGLYGRKDKWLIYDGQQRLQTLYSCLRYTFNNKVLIYDLLFDVRNTSEPEETGFSFIEKNDELSWHCIRMNELFSKTAEDEKRTFRKSVMKQQDGITDAEEEYIETNIDLLWDVFVKTDTKSLAYFPIKTSDEGTVNEVFERLNTGGMALSLGDLLFSKLKSPFYNFEEELQECSKRIYNVTGKGYLFTAYGILQALHLIVKGAVRVDPKKVSGGELASFKGVWEQFGPSLLSFFSDFIWGQFKINNAAIIPRHIALLPIIVYFYEIHLKGYVFKHFSSGNVEKLCRFFIKSQINDWNLQSYIDNFSSIIRAESNNSQKECFDFPIEKIEAFINKKRKRSTQVYEDSFTGFTWFTLKVLTPNRIYQFEPDIKGRFNPEIDHIFPKRLKGAETGYGEKVDVLWNMQPTKGEINSYKSNRHPKLFFTDKEKDAKGNNIIGSKYIDDYDFLFPVKNGKIEFSDRIWNDPLRFIEKRKDLMRDYLYENYGITLLKDERTEE